MFQRKRMEDNRLMKCNSEKQDPITEEGETSTCQHMTCALKQILSEHCLPWCILSQTWQIFKDSPKPIMHQTEKKYLVLENEALNHNNYIRVNFFHRSLSPLKHFPNCLNNASPVNTLFLLPPSDLRKSHLPSVLDRRWHVFLLYFCKTGKKNTVITIALVDSHGTFSWVYN